MGKHEMEIKAVPVKSANKDIIFISVFRGQAYY
jgi:hypothetical protein